MLSILNFHPTDRILVALKIYFGLPLGNLSKVIFYDSQDTKILLEQLVSQKKVLCERYGSHDYYRLHDEYNLDPQVVKRIQPYLKPFPESSEKNTPRKIRFCYSHIAGQFGVAWAQHLKQQGWLEQFGNQYRLTDEGEKKFSYFFQSSSNSDVEKKEGEHNLQSLCLDSSERQFHLADHFGLDVAKKFLEKQWLRRSSESSRAVEITDEGAIGLKEEFNFDVKLLNSK